MLGALLFPEIEIFAAAVAVRDADAPPLTAYFAVVDVGVIHELRQAQILGAEPADGLENEVGIHDEVAARRLELNLARQILLLGVQHVENGALADLLLFA